MPALASPTVLLTSSLPSVEIFEKLLRNAPSASVFSMTSPFNAVNSSRKRASGLVIGGKIGALVGACGRCAPVRNAARTRSKILSRAGSMPPPVIFEALLRWSREFALGGPGLQQRLGQAQSQRQPPKFRCDGVADRRLHCPQPDAKQETLDRAIELVLDGIATVVEQVMVQIDSHRANVRARATQRTGVGQM